tara:strand:+ start:11450 stop:12589 length:1140 start_codon:yes stop_codon:yes gene_type:complete
MKGSITPRGKNTWRLRYNGSPTPEGKRTILSETIHGAKKEAETLLRERLSSIESGTYVARKRETLAQFMESWLSRYASLNTTPRTMVGYKEKTKNYIIPCLGGNRIQSLTPRHIQDLHSYMREKGLSNQTITHAHRVLSEALKHAVAWKILPSNPAGSVKAPRPEQREVAVWDFEQMQTFIETSKFSQFHDAFMLAIFTGMRRSEITGLRWEGVDFTTSTLRVTGTLQRITGHGLLPGSPKTKTSRRAISVWQNTVDILHSIRGKQLSLHADLDDLYQNKNGYVITDDLGRPIDPNRLTREFARLVKQAGLPHANFHSLRHCHASLLLADGASIKTISERLGHSKPSMTLDVYSHLLPTIQAQAAQSLEERLSGSNLNR